MHNGGDYYSREDAVRECYLREGEVLVRAEV